MSAALFSIGLVGGRRGGRTFPTAPSPTTTPATKVSVRVDMPGSLTRSESVTPGLARRHSSPHQIPNEDSHLILCISLPVETTTQRPQDDINTWMLKISRAAFPAGYGCLRHARD